MTVSGQLETPHLDKILERRAFTPSEESALDLTGIDGNPDGVVDVRDLVVFLNGQPISFWFETEQTLAKSWVGNVSVPIRFSRAVSGTISFSFGGTAVAGTAPGSDFTPPSGSLVLPPSSYQAEIPLSILPKSTLGQARYVVLTLQTPPTGNLVQIIPGNGESERYSSHVVRIVDADKGLYGGTISFPADRVEEEGGSTTFVANAAISPSIVRAGLRSSSGASQLVVELPDTGLFPQGITFSVTLDEANGTFVPVAPVEGTTQFDSLNREVSWSVELGEIDFLNSEFLTIQSGQKAASFEAELLITISGLSATDRTVEARGAIVASLIEDVAVEDEE